MKNQATINTLITVAPFASVILTLVFNNLLRNAIAASTDASTAPKSLRKLVIMKIMAQLAGLAGVVAIATSVINPNLKALESLKISWKVVESVTLTQWLNFLVSATSVVYLSAQRSWIRSQHDGGKAPCVELWKVYAQSANFLRHTVAWVLVLAVVGLFAWLIINNSTQVL